ncbi:MAG: hypothetical protein SPK35_10130, partial [Prevotella sp.]|nr:hypothetical protein [Prevotella sp.]
LVKDWTNYNAVRRHLTPPAIILMSADDAVVPPLTNGMRYYEACARPATLVPCMYTLQAVTAGDSVIPLPTMTR